MARYFMFEGNALNFFDKEGSVVMKKYDLQKDGFYYDETKSARVTIKNKDEYKTDSNDDTLRFKMNFISYEVNHYYDGYSVELIGQNVGVDLYINLTDEEHATDREYIRNVVCAVLSQVGKNYEIFSIS